MKAQLSRHSYRQTEHYSGVYQQQGRMLTDADWNELVDVVKRQQQQSLKAAVGSGVPRDGGVLRVTDSRSGPGEVTVNASLRWGSVVVDGIIGEAVPSDATVTTFNYTKQRFFTDPPPDPGANVTYYADVWERLVVSIQDPGLRDPALHGADTCVRTQVMAQIKTCADPDFVEDETRNPPRGNAVFGLTHAPNAVDEDDTCATETSVARDLGNYLFRLEVHSVDGAAASPAQVVLKWSSENGAEAHRIDEHQPPPEFQEGSWIYEFFSDTTEQHLGVHEEWDAAQRSQMPLDAESYAEAAAGIDTKVYPYVRRWDGYCVINNPSGDAPVLDKHKHRGGPLTSPVIDGNGVLKLAIDDLELTLGMTGRRFVAGDYWLALLRQHGSDHDQPHVPSGEPVGIVHHYLKLLTRESRKVVFPQALDDVRRLSFPALTDLTAERVQYDPDLTTQSRWTDINETAALMPRTVQDALDQLAANLEASDIFYKFLDTCDVTAYGVPSLNTHLRKDLGTEAPNSSTKIKDLWDKLLCKLDAARVPYDPTAKEARWRDIKELPSGAPSPITAPATVQEALDDLVENLESSDIEYRLPDCGDATATPLSLLQSDVPGWADFDEDDKISAQDMFDALLCHLDSAHIPYSTEAAETIRDWLDQLRVDVDARVKIAGDTMTGDLAVPKVGVGVDRDAAGNIPGGKLHISGGDIAATFGKVVTAVEIDNHGNETTALQANGPNGPFRISVQDGHGRLSQTWNAYDSGTRHKYDRGGEGAVWLRLHMGDFLVRTAPAGEADANIDWNTGLYQAPDGKVGIGTTNPGGPLSIRGNGGQYDVGVTQNQVGSTATMELTTTDASGDQATRLLLRGHGDNADIEFYRGARGSESRSMIIKGDTGRVGVNEDTPKSELDVAGTIRMTGFSMPPPPRANINNYVLTADAAGTGTWRPAVTVGWQLSGDDVYSTVAGTVGIGTNDPKAGKLEIESPWGDWLFLRQKRNTEGGGGFHFHNPWRNNDSDDRNALAIAYMTAGGEHLWSKGFSINGPTGDVTVGGGFLNVRGKGGEETYIGGDGAGNDVQIGSNKAGVMNVGFWNPTVGGTNKYMNIYYRVAFPNSDRRSKTNIKNIRGALDKITALRGVTFRWKEDDSTSAEAQHFGLIAQEVQKVIPEVVSQGRDKQYGVSYESIIPILVEAVKEQQKKIETLEQLLGDLTKQSNATG